LWAAALFIISSCALDADAPQPQSGGGDLDGTSADGVSDAPSMNVCNHGRMRCLSKVRTDQSGRIQRFAAAAVPGRGAADLQSAYKLDVSVDPHATIAIVDAYNYKNAESDLATYRSQMGLSPCTVASGCLTIVNQNGQASPMPADAPPDDDWTVESA